jgi:15-cis-phytoene synthase
MALSIENIEIRNSKSNFYYSFLFLPPEKREAINTVYSFCDISDNIVDSGDSYENRKNMLYEWRDELKKCRDGKSKFDIQNKTGNVIDKFSIPFEYFFYLLDGMEMDLNNTTYNTFDDLYKYCYNVASAVGLISGKIFGYQNKIMEEYAVDLGIALQLTNIIRDVKEDARMGRLYLPMDEMEKFNVNPDDIFSNKYSDELLNLLIFQYERAMHYYEESDRKLHPNDKNNFIAARIMRNIYFAVLKKIRRKGFKIFEGKTRINKMQKIMIALKTHLD